MYTNLEQSEKMHHDKALLHAEKFLTKIDRPDNVFIQAITTKRDWVKGKIKDIELNRANNALRNYADKLRMDIRGYRSNQKCSRPTLPGWGRVPRCGTWLGDEIKRTEAKMNAALLLALATSQSTKDAKKFCDIYQGKDEK